MARFTKEDISIEEIKDYMYDLNYDREGNIFIASDVSLKEEPQFYYKNGRPSYWSDHFPNTLDKQINTIIRESNDERLSFYGAVSTFTCKEGKPVKKGACNVVNYNALFFDIDFKLSHGKNTGSKETVDYIKAHTSELLEQLKDHLDCISFVGFTGGGFCMYIVLENNQDVNDSRVLAKKIEIVLNKVIDTEMFDVDSSVIADTARACRVLGTRNAKTGVCSHYVYRNVDDKTGLAKRFTTNEISNSWNLDDIDFSFNTSKKKNNSKTSSLNSIPMYTYNTNEGNTNMNTFVVSEVLLEKNVVLKDLPEYTPLPTKELYGRTIVDYTPLIHNGQTRQWFVCCQVMSFYGDKINRENTLFWMVNILTNNGYSLEETLNVVRNYNNLSIAPISDEEVCSATISGANKEYHKNNSDFCKFIGIGDEPEVMDNCHTYTREHYLTVKRKEWNHKDYERRLERQGKLTKKQKDIKEALYIGAFNQMMFDTDMYWLEGECTGHINYTMLSYVTGRDVKTLKNRISLYRNLTCYVGSEFEKAMYERESEKLLSIMMLKFNEDIDWDDCINIYEESIAEYEGRTIEEPIEVVEDNSQDNEIVSLENNVIALNEDIDKEEEENNIVAIKEENTVIEGGLKEAVCFYNATLLNAKNGKVGKFLSTNNYILLSSSLLLSSSKNMVVKNENNKINTHRNINIRGKT